MKVVLQYEAGPALKQRLAALAVDDLDVVDCPEPDPEGFAREMRDAEVLWHILAPVTAAVIAGAPQLRLIQKIGVGVNTIDLPAARAAGVAVSNMPGTNGRAVAELTLGLMLAVLRRIPAFDRDLRTSGTWGFSPEIQDDLGEIGGRTVGIVGYGAVPQILAPILVAMGARVLYASREPKLDAVGERRSLPDLLAESDIVSLHVPLTPETTNLIDAAAIARMRPGAMLVNTARGALVDQAALVAALTSGHLRGAGLDVFPAEPVPSDNPLLGLDNVVVMPHVAWFTQETLARSIGVAAENCRRLRDGEPLLNRIP
jgi:phosphoglycerate dehydrogenase-like enzyme